MYLLLNACLHLYVCESIFVHPYMSVSLWSLSLPLWLYLSSSLCVSFHVCVYVSLFMSVCVRFPSCLCVCLSSCLCPFMAVSLYLSSSLCVSFHVCVCVSLHICVWVSPHVCVSESLLMSVSLSLSSCLYVCVCGCEGARRRNPGRGSERKPRRCKARNDQ